MQSQPLSDAVLSKISILAWTRGTVAKMIRKRRLDSPTWNACWFETYQELGGRSIESGTKGCPCAAARGLWILGRFRFGERPFQEMTIKDIYWNVSKNAAYAVVAIDLMREGVMPVKSELWPRIRATIEQATGMRPADSEQGAVRIAIALFRHGEIIIA